jgi:hypothetical protein
MSISIIIPALNEAAHLAATIQSAQSPTTCEVLVIDGGSCDATIAIAEVAGAQVIRTEPGRARQMNAGAKVARGNILLFLHADTRLPRDFDWYVQQALTQEEAVAGAFQLGLDGTQRGLRFIETMANWRSRWWQMPYGDQAIFLRADVFARAGGFPDLPLMEDFELMRRLRKQGRIVLAPVAVVSSARRWLQLGVVKTTAVNQLLIAAYLAGVAPATLVRWYRRERGLNTKPIVETDTEVAARDHVM